MYNDEELLNAIWDNPQRVTGLQWEMRGGVWQSRQRLDGSETTRRDKTTLERGRTNHGNPTIWVHYHGTTFSKKGQTIWDFIAWKNSTNEFLDVLQIVGDAYGIAPDTSDYTPEQKERAAKRRSERELLKEIADCVTKSLPLGYGEAARDYLAARNLQPTERLGAWNSKLKAAIRKRITEKYGLTTKVADDYIRRYFPLTRPDYKEGSTPTWVDFSDSYQLVLPYYNGAGNVVGFCVRCTAKEAPTWTDEHGEVQTMPKYLYSKDMPKGGYCGALHGGDEAVLLVEGMIDAETLKQHGFMNVLALGGITPTDNDEDAARSTIKTLQRYNAKKLIYIPDCEYYTAADEARGRGKAGERKTDATRSAIAALLPYMTGQQYGNGFAALRVADLETAESRQNHTKEDANTFIPKCGAGTMRGVLDNAVAWYEYELQAITKQHAGDADDMAAAAVDVFSRINNPTQQQRLKDAITAAKSGYLAELKAAGVTASALSLVERDGKNATTAARIAEIYADMGKAKTRETWAAQLTRAQRVLNADTFATFAAQVNITREDMHKLVAAKPEYLQTPWKLWRYKKETKTDYSPRCISFAPAAVSIIAAPTNHGKTLILLQAAINAARTTGKQFIYISFENDAEQLYIRAVTACMGSVWQDAYTKDADGNAVPLENPRAEVRDVIKSEDAPKVIYTANGTQVDIQTYIDGYWRDVAPRLALVRTEADIDAVTTNVQAQVEAWRAAGMEVGGIFVDYLQLLHYPALRAHSRTDEVKGICDRLNDMAKATALPVVLAAQFNRDATKAGGDKLDGIELANIGESAGIENIAEDVYLVWQVDKIKPDSKEYYSTDSKGQPKEWRLQPYQYRSRRCFGEDTRGEEDKLTPLPLREGHLYVENMKARDYATGGYCLLKFNGAAGAITDDNSIHTDKP